MLNKIFELFKQKKPEQGKAKPLKLSTQYHYKSSTNNLFKNQLPDVIKVYENASKLPLLKNANLSFCEVSSGTTFIGFNKPKLAQLLGL